MSIKEERAMNSELNAAVAQERVGDLFDAAERARVARPSRRTRPRTRMSTARRRAPMAALLRVVAR
jgi:hypothetical protein